MSVESPREVSRRFFAEQDRLRGGPAPELCAPGYTAHIVGNPPFDLAGHQQFARAFYAGFPDVFHTVDEPVAEGDRVSVRFVLRGTHTGDFMGIPPTQRPIEVEAIAMMRVADGKVAELRGMFDQLGLLRQLGVG
jgi:predicted ester cyclase